MKIYTKTGDSGETSLFTGERINKDTPRVGTYGAVDEANSALAMARAFSEIPAVKQKIYDLQKILPRLMADLASLNRPAKITESDIKQLEDEMDEMDKNLPPLKNFVIPGDTKAGAMLDLARTVIRRAERNFYVLARLEAVHGVDGLFLNRLSDYCFMLMRVEEHFTAKKAAVLV
ncbi:MAG: cob(I)yrinic acid a,c-diamide adenosyltransferase [Selenomonadaceae bacterium]|nr:cob(I)yrinic acid a,c-diamide adenosyltransferase [Selenomonadaceae bacterium]